jgi:hypothetical protein
MVDIEPPEDLPAHWHPDFRSAFVKCYRKKLASFDIDQFRNRVEQHVEKEKEHRKLLNLCIFPFNNSPSPSDFHFVQADPLEELGEPNFDFLLWDFNGQAIFGEAKANVAQGPLSLINEVEEQREAVEKNMEYIVKNYLGEEPRHTEFVLATFASDADQVTRKAISEGKEIVTWAIHQMDKSITVNEVLPRSSDIPKKEDIDDVRIRIKHANHELNRTLESADTAEGAFDLFPESDPLAKLRTLITAQYSRKGHCFVNQRRVQQIVDDDLFYIDSEERDEIVDDIIELGKKIEFLRECEEDDFDYKLVSRYTHSDGLEKTLRKKWIKHRIEDKKGELWDGCVENAKEKIAMQSQLEDY